MGSKKGNVGGEGWGNTSLEERTLALDNFSKKHRIKAGGLAYTETNALLHKRNNSEDWNVLYADKLEWHILRERLESRINPDTVRGDIKEFADRMGVQPSQMIKDFKNYSRNATVPSYLSSVSSGDDPNHDNDSPPNIFREGIKNPKDVRSQNYAIIQSFEVPVWDRIRRGELNIKDVKLSHFSQEFQNNFSSMKSEGLLENLLQAISNFIAGERGGSAAAVKSTLSQNLGVEGRRANLGLKHWEENPVSDGFQIAAIGKMPDSDGPDPGYEWNPNNPALAAPH